MSSGKIDTKSLLAELNARKGRNGGDGDRERTKSDLTETQQADALMAHVAAFTSPPTFKVMDFVRYRPERRGVVRNGDKLHMVVGKIDPPHKVDITYDNMSDPFTYRQYDLFVSICDVNDKGNILTYAVDSRDLEPYPDGDRLKGQGNA